MSIYEKPELDVLFDGLYHLNPNINRNASFKLVEFWPDEALSRLIANLGHHNIEIRRKTVKAFGPFGARAFESIVYTFENNDDLVIHISCLKALVQIAAKNKKITFPKEVMKIIELALSKDTPELILTVIPLLRQLETQGLPFLIEASKDSNILKAMSAVTALSEIDDPLAKRSLEKLLEDDLSDDLLRESLRQALKTHEIND